jgi:hypothetical protein
LQIFPKLVIALAAVVDCAAEVDETPVDVEELPDAVIVGV